MKHRERETQGERHIGRDIMTQWEKEIQTQGETKDEQFRGKRDRRNKQTECCTTAEEAGN